MIYIPAVFLPAVCAAQDELSEPVSTTYAITHVHIIQAPGRTIDNGTVVIRNGLIEAVGKEVAVPKDAIVIAADSMYLYAGFIDGLSHAGVDKLCEHKENVSPKDPGHPLPEQAGITPYTDVRDILKHDDHAIKELRCYGFTAAQVVPHGVFMPGSGALILLGGNTPGKMVLQDGSSFYSEFTWKQGVFPSTIMGAMARWRELYRQAEKTKSYEAVYASGRSGMPRPSSNRVLSAFYPVIESRRPVLFRAEKVLEVHHALALQRDLNIPAMMIAEIKEGWDLTDKLKASGTKVFLSLDLPEEDKKDKDKKDKDDKGHAKEKEKTKEEHTEKEEKSEEEEKPAAKDTVETDPEKVALKARRIEFIRKYESQAAVFQRAGIKFGFSTLNVKSKHIHDNLRRMILAGLSEDTALAALTTNPAEMLGVSDLLGTVDRGKIANLVITDKPYFGEKVCIQYMFVDGRLYDCKKDKTKKAGADAKGIEGTWSLTTDTPHGKVDLKVVFRKEESGYTGVISGGKLPAGTKLTSVKLEGQKLRFAYSVTYDDKNEVDVTVKGTLEGSAFKGDMIVGEYGTYPIEGSKSPERKEE